MKTINIKIITVILLNFCFITAFTNTPKLAADTLAVTQQITPKTPLVVTQKITPKSSTSIWQMITKDFKLDHKAQTPEVQKEIRRLMAEKTKFQQILQASTPYLYFIHQSTRAKGLPGELVLIPIIESEFNPNDHSNVGALGLWQLMSSTARQLGVKISSGYDGRRNIITSTNAALAHFKYLGSVLKGNWYYAVAAYNCGQGRLEYAQRHYGARPVWHLSVPRDTKAYVARLLAIAHVLKNPTKYGIVLPPIENKPFFAEVKMKQLISLTKLSQNNKANLVLLQKLNPDYRRHGTLLRKNGSYSVLVPSQLAAGLKI